MENCFELYENYVFFIKILAKQKKVANFFPKFSTKGTLKIEILIKMLNLLLFQKYEFEYRDVSEQKQFSQDFDKRNKIENCSID